MRKALLWSLAVLLICVLVLAALVIINSNVAFHGGTANAETRSQVIPAGGPHIPRRAQGRLHGGKHAEVIHGRGGQVCRKNTEFVALNSIVTHQDLFKLMQIETDCYVAGQKFTDHSFQTDHWINNAPNNIWHFVESYPPVTDHGQQWHCPPSCPSYPWQESAVRARFDMCMFHWGCLRTVEVRVWQRIFPFDWGYEGGWTQ